MPFFSVVIPVFNREKLIEKTLSSVLDQTFDDFEVIVVDDGSTDDTIQVLSRFSESILSKSMTVLQQKNAGPGAARNAGIEGASGQYVAFLDSDDLWFPWTLETYKQVIDRTHANFISGVAFDFSQPSELETIEARSLEFETFKDYLSAHHRAVWTLPSATAIQTQALKQSGGFTSRWINGEDSDLWLKLGTTQGFATIQLPYVSAYRRHEVSAIANSEKTIQGSYHLIEQEKDKQYPGSFRQQRQRRDIISRHIRPVSIACLRQKDLQNAWNLYMSTFWWHLRLGRIKYLAAFWIVAFLSTLRPESSPLSE